MCQGQAGKHEETAAQAAGQPRCMAPAPGTDPGRESAAVPDRAPEMRYFRGYVPGHAPSGTDLHRRHQNPPVMQ